MLHATLLSTLLFVSDVPTPLPVQVEPPALDPALSFADWNGDGRLDALALRPDGGVLLLLGAADGGFEDHTRRAGLADVRGVHAAAWADVDGDGALDLYLAAWRGTSRLFLQGERGLFEDHTEAAGLPLHAAPRAARFFDYDRDGRVDLHLITAHDDLVFHNTGEGRFERIEMGLLPRLRLPGALHGAPLAGFMPQDVDSALTAPAAGGGTVTQGAGASVRTLTPLGSVNQALGTGLCAGSIEYQATGNCLQASSLPQLGMLYPLSTAWFVSTAGRVGLGTTAPSASLHIVDPLAPAVLLERSGGAQVRTIANLLEGAIGTVNATNFRLLTNNTVRMHLDTAGNLGIGTTAPTTRLHVVAPGARAVYGHSRATSGSAFGGEFQSDSTLGIGVRGTSPNIGVEGAATGSAGIGLFGSGDSRAIFGVNSTAGGVGAELIASGSAATGVLVQVPSTVGATRGVSASVSSTDGVALLGVNSAANAGVGVKGVGTFGVSGEGSVGCAGFGTLASGAIGVFGQSNSATSGYGVVGQSSGSEGRAVFANAIGEARYGVYSQVQSTSGYAGYFLGRAHFSGNVGIGTTSPMSRLDVRADSAFGNAVLSVERAADAASSTDVVQIKLGAGSADNSQFIECERGTDVEFRVFGNGNVTADGTFTGGGADYAEWLLRLQRDEELAPGDVVGVFGGRVTRATRGADHILVVSSDPVLVGNGRAVERDGEAGYARVGLLGQVPVRVRGAVAVGDLLVPSGRGDGTARALAPESLDPELLTTVFATAWEAHRGDGEGTVNAALGVDAARAAAHVTCRLAAQLEALERRLAALEPR